MRLGWSSQEAFLMGLTWLLGRPLLSGTNSVDWTAGLLRRFTNWEPESDSDE